MNFDFIKKHPDLFTFFGLCIIFYFIFFFGIGSYSLMDIDETRYASMAHDMFRSKDFMTLYLNGEYFFEKPPLYFWLECLSFGLFGKVTEFTVRFPCALMGALSCFIVYFVGRKVVSGRYGLFSALILAGSTEFFILSKFAILDIVLCFCTTFAIFFGFMTLFCKEQNKKYFWWLFYIFSGLAVLAKGIPGFVLPFGTLFFSYITAKKFKELFKPSYFIVGTIIFLAIVTPWHIAMLQKHDPLFFNEYIMKHHIARFTTSAELGRKQPFYFFLLTILWGFFPYILPALLSCKTWFKKIIQTFKNGFCFPIFNNTQKFITLNFIGALLTLAFFSASSTKLVTYILPIFPFLACLTAGIFEQYSEKSEYKKPIDVSSRILGFIFVLAGIAAPVSYMFIPKIITDTLGGGTVFLPIMFIVLGIYLIFAPNFKNGVISALTALIIFLSAIGIPVGFNVDFAFGQNDLIKFAKYAAQNENQLASFGFGRRFSLNYYNGKHVIYEQFPIYERLTPLLNDKNTVIVVKNKDMEEHSKNTKFTIIEHGIKYSLIKG